MNKTLLTVILAVLLVAATGCNVLFPKGQSKSPYYPLAEGNKWTYETKVSTTEGEKKPLEKTYKRTEEVTGETELTGKEKLTVWGILSSESSQPNMRTLKCVRVDTDWVYTYISIKDEKPSFKQPNNPKLGDKWEVAQTMNNGKDTMMILKYEVVADKETVNGYKNCLKIKNVISPTDKKYKVYEEWENIMYWAPDVGFVYGKSKSVQMKIKDSDTTLTTVVDETKLISSTLK